MIRLRTSDPDFAARFTALLAQARETTETVDAAVAAIIAAIRARDGGEKVASDQHDRNRNGLAEGHR